jgi:hypothetical protein
MRITVTKRTTRVAVERERRLITAKSRTKHYHTILADPYVATSSSMLASKIEKRILGCFEKAKKSTPAINPYRYF